MQLAPNHDVLSKEMPAVSQPQVGHISSTVTTRGYHPVDHASNQYFIFGFFSFFSLSNVFLSEQNVLLFPRKEMALITIIPTGMICADEACGNGGPHVGLSPEDKLDRIGGSP